MNARAVRRLRPVALYRHECRRWAALLDGGPTRDRAERFRADVEETTRTGEIPQEERTTDEFR